MPRPRAIHAVRRTGRVLPRRRRGRRLPGGLRRGPSRPTMLVSCLWAVCLWPACLWAIFHGRREGRPSPPPPHPTPARAPLFSGGRRTHSTRARTHTRHARTRAQVPCAAGRKERRTILDLQAFPYLQHAARRYRVRLDVFKRETPTEFAPEQLARPPPEPARAADDVDEAFEAVRFGRARRPEAARFGRARRPEAARFGGLIPGTAPCVCGPARPSRLARPAARPSRGRLGNI